MNAKFKKLAIAAGVSTALAGASMPSHALVEGLPGEALLVPFVLAVGGVDTIVQLTVAGKPRRGCT